MARSTILQIVPELDTGGAELSAVEISEALVRVGARALIATEGGRLEETARQQGAEIIRFPAATKNPLRMLANARRLAAIVGEQGIDLIHARSRAPAWSGLWAARKTRVPFVTTYHGAYGEKGPVKRHYNGVMARGDRVIANSQYTFDLIRSRYDTSPERLRVIHRGVDAAYDPNCVGDDRIAAIRSRWGIAAEARIVLQAARLTGWKGQAVLIAAAGRLASAGRLGDVVIVLAGDAQGRDDYRKRLQNQIAELGLTDRILLVGHETDMAAAFAAAHVSVIASTEPEAFGRAGAESQALGCPVIATRLGAPQETVLAEPEVDATKITGWLVAPGDVGALAQSLGVALELDPVTRNAIGERARNNVLQNFTLEKMKYETLKVYDELLHKQFASAFDYAPVNTQSPGSS